VVTVLVDLGVVPVAQTVALVLAQNPEPPADKGPEFGKASPIALVVVILLGIATMFLIRSMTKHLRKVPASFDRPEEPEERPAGGRSAGPDTGRGTAEAPPER
jgi:hypothetical protein